MSYNVKSIDVFERQAIRLIKKYSSLKLELVDLVNELNKTQNKGLPSEEIVIK